MKLFTMTIATWVKSDTSKSHIRMQCYHQQESSSKGEQLAYQGGDNVGDFYIFNLQFYCLYGKSKL